MTTLTLGQLKDALSQFSLDHEVRLDLPARVQPTSLASWRGAYAELALGYEALSYATTSIKVGELVRRCEEANGRTYEGWKGGSYRMTYRTPVYLDNPGCYTSTEIVGARFDGYDVLLRVRGRDDE